MLEKKIEGLKSKEKIRTEILPLVSIFLNNVGVSWTKIGKSRMGVATLIAQGKKIAETIKPERAAKPLNVYFLTMLGGNIHNVSIDIILAWGLKQKGHNVHFILDDQSLPITDETIAGEEKRWNEIRARSYNFGDKYIRTCGFKVLRISEIINLQQERNISAFSSIIEAGLLKHYKVGMLNDELPFLKQKEQLLKESARISALAGDYLVTQFPDRVIMSHGIYPTWGPAFEILKEAGVPVVTYGRGKKANTQKFNWNMTSDWWDVSDEWERVKNIPLNDAQHKKIAHYLKTRISHSEDALVYNFGALEDREKTLTRFNLDPGKLTFTLFTNVLWDAASAQREIVFKNPLEWVFETIEWFASHPEKQLIVKIHPAEVVIGTNQPFADLIRKRIPHLPSNVRLIKPDEKVNSWSIYQVTDLGIVHTTTAGMELPLMDIPCIVVSSTHFRGRGFTIDVNSKKSYFDYLNTFKKENTETEKLKTLAERYAYLLFERYQIPFLAIYEEVSLQTLCFAIKHVNDLWNDKNISMIIDNIINEKTFLISE